MYLIIVFFFYLFKTCIITIIKNVVGDESTPWTGIDCRIKYFLNLNKPYINNTIYDDNRMLHSWINGNKLFILALIALNTYFFVKCKL